MRAVVLGVLAAATVAHADQVPVEPPDPADTQMFKAPTGRDIVIDTPNDRSTSNIILVSSLAGGGAILGGIGLYFHLDSRSQSDKVSATAPTGRPWTGANQSAVDTAASDRTAAAVFYGVGGALIIAAAVTLMLTDPGSTRTVIHPHTALAPVPGGAIAMHEWSF